MKYIFLILLILLIPCIASAELNAAITANATCHLGIPLAVQFEGLCTEEDGTILWDFGDGNTTDEQSPLYSYVYYDAFTITHTCTPAGGDPVMDFTYITVAPIGDITCNGDIPDGNVTMLVQGESDPSPYLAIGATIGILLGLIVIRRNEMP